MSKKLAIVKGGVDYFILEKRIKKQFNKQQFKKFFGALRKRFNKRYPIDSTFDCTGNLCRSYLDVNFKNGNIIIIVSNYLDL